MKQLFERYRKGTAKSVRALGKVVEGELSLIDEHRKAYAPTLWVKSTPKQGPTYPARDLDHVEQRWFVGAHANVGGGYEDDLLAQIPLEWLMSKAIAHGLEFKESVVVDGNVNTCPIHDCLAEMAHGVYKLLTLGKHYYRPMCIGCPWFPVDSATYLQGKTKLAI